MDLWVQMMKNDATIRHQVSRGNGGNPIVNDRIPMRFIIAPTDVANVTWMQAEGAGDGNGNLNADLDQLLPLAAVVTKSLGTQTVHGVCLPSASCN